MRKTSEKPSATTANKLPWSKPPMTIWISASTETYIAAKLCSRGERDAPGFTEDHPRTLGGIPACHHRVVVIETALRVLDEVEEPVDPRFALESREVVAQL